MSDARPDDMQALAEDCRLIDVRTGAEFGAAHIEGSTNVPLHVLEKRGAAAIDAPVEGPILLVCRTGQRAERARALLGGDAGHRIEVLPGGLVAWEAAGHPVARGAKAAMSIERQVRIASGSLVVMGTALGAFVHPAALALPAFVGSGLVFAGVTDTCGMGMLLARMPWNR